MNEDYAIMHGYTWDHLKKYERLFVLKDKETEIIMNYINNYILGINNVKSSINIQLGLLTHEERIYLVDFCEALS